MLINPIKLIKAGVAVLVAMGTLVCCERQDLDEPVRAQNAVSFSAGVYNALKTRDSGDSWSINDEIGVFMVNKGQTTIAGDAANKKYVTEKGNGDFSAAGDDEIFYPEDGARVDFIAYYPYQSAINTLGTYSVNVADQSDPEAIDLLYAKATNNDEGYDESKTTPVDLTFRHQLGKLQLVVTNTASELGVSIQEFNNMTAEVTGLKTTATFNLADATLDNKGGVAPISLRKVPGGGAAFDALVIPDAIAEDAAKVTFTVGEETFEWTLPATTFESGKANSYQILLKEPPPPRGIYSVFSAKRRDAGDKTIETESIPTQPGDYVFVFAHNGNGNPAGHATAYPAGPAEYNLVTQTGDGNNRKANAYYTVATGESTELGQWTNTDALAITVLRGVSDESAIIGFSSQNGSGVGGPDFNFPNIDASNFTGKKAYILALASSRTGQSVASYSDALNPIALTGVSGGAGLWAGITQYAHTTMPALSGRFSGSYGNYTFITIALESDDPVLEGEDEP